MSKPISHETKRLMRQHVIQDAEKAAREDKVSIQADAFASLSQPNLLFVNAPISNLEQLDVEALLNGKLILDETPIMYWQLSGDAFDGTIGSISPGFYTVVASQKSKKRGVISLRDARGKTVAEGDLVVDTAKPRTGVKQTKSQKVKVSGGITKFEYTIIPPSIEVCGYVTVKVGKATVKMDGCIEAG